MIYEEFKGNFKDDIKEALADKGFDVTIKENRTEKLNESFDSISVTPEGSRIGVNLNMESKPMEKSRQDPDKGNNSSTRHTLFETISLPAGKSVFRLKNSTRTGK